MIEGSGFGSRKPKNMWIRWIRIRNSGCHSAGRLAPWFHGYSVADPDSVSEFDIRKAKFVPKKGKNNINFMFGRRSLWMAEELAGSFNIIYADLIRKVVLSFLIPKSIFIWKPGSRCGSRFKHLRIPNGLLWVHIGSAYDKHNFEDSNFNALGKSRCRL
jgi:hypothetical protein